MTYTGVSPRRARVLCNTAPAATRSYCWTGIGEMLGSFDRRPSKSTARCNAATTNFIYRQDCYRGAGV
jgi:hypothetical protein